MIFLALNFLSNHGLSCLQKLDSSGLCRDFHCPVVHNIEDKSRMWIQTDNCYPRTPIYLYKKVLYTLQALLSDFNSMSRSNDPFKIEA